MAISRDLFAITAAHGFTSKAAATWFPQLPRTPRVMVPLHLDALVLRHDPSLDPHQPNSQTKWADTRMAPPSGSGDPVPRLSLLPDPFAELPAADVATLRKRGVHLHWALPDGLTRATTNDATTPATFTPIPDRWLVVRMFPAQDGSPRRAVRGWVLVAGGDKPEVHDLIGWTEPGPCQGSKGPLTAAGHGDPAWAAYYDNVLNRLSFYDDLSDIRLGPLAYMVCGWYSDSLQDPLGTNIHSLSAFDAKMAQLGWELDTGELQESYTRFSAHAQTAEMVGLPTAETFRAASSMQSLSRLPVTTIQSPPAIAGSSPAGLDASGHPSGGSYQSNGAWWPSQIVCHGSVVAIGWPDVGFPGADKGLISEEAGGPPPANAVRVVFGNTLTEAISEMVALTNNKPEQARVLEAFIVGAMQELDQPDGTSRVDVRLHANAFGSLPGGETTETITLPGHPAPPTLPAGPVTPQPGIFPPIPPRGDRGIINLPVSVAVSQATTAMYASPELRSERVLLTGHLSDVIHQVTQSAQTAGQTTAQAPTPPRQVTVKRSLPRKFHPSDPVVLLQGCGRSYKHGADGRYSEDNKLICRLTGFAHTETACSSIGGGPVGRPSITGDDLLQNGIENGSVPPECEDLLRETVLQDPGTAVPSAQISTNLQGAALQSIAQNFMVEQTSWWATRDIRVDHGPLIAVSGIRGTLPSPISVTAPIPPWTPLHLDWQVQYIPSPGGAGDWVLTEIDYTPKDGVLPSATDTKSGVILTGRALLTGGAPANIAASVRLALKQSASAAGSEPLVPLQIIQHHSAVAQKLTNAYADIVVQSAISNASAGGNGGPAPVNGGIPAIDRSALGDIATTLENMDVLGGAFDNFHTRLRGGIIGDGTTTTKAPGKWPDAFVATRSGFLRILRLRLVDSFGQFVDLDPAKALDTEPVSIPQRPDIAAMPPRFTSPARLWFRFMDAGGTDREATPDLSPICGYVLPNHLDGDLEFFDIAGANLGDLRPDPTTGILWEDAPGVPSTVGASPELAVPNSFLAGIARGLLDWGLADADANREDALSAMLRIIDSTLWSVDPFGHTGDEHLSLLIGHPVAVIRARLRLEVDEPVNPNDVNRLTFPLRIGALTHWQDGLFGYFINDDYRTLYCADGAVAGFAREVGPGQGFLQPINLVDNYYQNFSNDLGADVTEGKSPVTHPYVDDTGVLHTQPNQDINLTLLVEPHSVVHATAGLLPRKEIGVRREWIADALAKISPTFRFGPVLVDPKRLRMPVPNDIHGTWSWDHRSDITTWAEDKVVNDTGDALITDDPAKGQEGWLRLTPEVPKPPA
jgi:hypothetical protein